MSFHSMFDAAHAAAPHAHGWAGHACHGPHFGGVALGLGVGALVFFLVRGAMRRRYARAHGYGYAGCGPGGFGHHGWHGHHGGHGHHGWHGHREHGGFRGFGGGGKRMLRFLFTRLETSPSQEKVIREVVDEVREAARALRSEGREIREELGDAFVGEVFDEAAFDAAFEGPESKLREFRQVVAGALAKVHEVLTPDQRKELAAIFAAGPGFFGRRGRGF